MLLGDLKNVTLGFAKQTRRVVASVVGVFGNFGRSGNKTAARAFFGDNLGVGFGVCGSWYVAGKLRDISSATGFIELLLGFEFIADS